MSLIDCILFLFLFFVVLSIKGSNIIRLDDFTLPHHHYHHDYHDIHVNRHFHHPHVHYVNGALLDPYFVRLKNRLHYYFTHNLPPPKSLLNEYNRHIRANRARIVHLPLHNHLHHAHDYFHFHTDYAGDDEDDDDDHFDSHHGYHRQLEHLHMHDPDGLDLTSHHHYHYNEHPVFDELGRKVIYTTGNLERFPPSNYF